MNETQAAHTPGPLEAQQSSVSSGLWWIIDPVSGFVIGEAIRDIEQDMVAPAEANARLWADAPRLKEVNEVLLAACEKAFEALTTEWLYQTGQFSRVAVPPTNYPPQGSVHGDTHNAMGVLKAAIALARGVEAKS